MTVDEEMKIIEEISNSIIKRGRLLYSYEIREILDKFIIGQEGEWRPLCNVKMKGEKE